MELGFIIFLALAAVSCRIYFLGKMKRQAGKDKKALGRVSYPKASHPDGRSKSVRERKGDLRNYYKSLQVNGRAYAQSEKKNQLKIGATQYLWHSADDGDDCEQCAKNNGKIFSWRKPPATGHPGEGKCCPHGHCRCWAEAIFKD